MQHMRLFWAINLPIGLKDDLYNRIRLPLSNVPANLKWVEKENIHLTLKFLGDIENGQVKQIVEAVGNEVCRFGPLQFEVKGLGCFPERKRPRVFWAGLSGKVEELRKLQYKIQQAHVPLGFKLERRGFAPHITLARFRSPEKSMDFMQKAEELVPGDGAWGSFSATTIELMQSIISKNGPTYHVLEQVHL